MYFSFVVYSPFLFLITAIVWTEHKSLCSLTCLPLIVSSWQLSKSMAGIYQYYFSSANGIWLTSFKFAFSQDGSLC